MLSGKKESMNSRLKEAYVNLIQDFLVNIDKKKKRILDEIQHSAEYPEAIKFWSSYR